MKRFLLALVMLLAGAANAGAQLTDKPGLWAAAGKLDITPTRPAWIAGYGMNRRSTGARDPVWARCLVLADNGNTIAFVACDLIGLPRYQIEKVRARVKGVKPDRLLIASTHTHSGPDTLGQWGPDLRTSGVDQAWMAETTDRIARLVDETAAKLRPAALKFASTKEVPRSSKNSRVARILDKELGVMEVTARDGKSTLGTLVNFACHPETLNNRQMTSDFPHWLRETVEKEKGGVCVFLNGALGGMVTTDFEELPGKKGENWAAAEEIGAGLGRRVVEILKDAPTAADASITTQRRVFRVPMENKSFLALIRLKVFPGDIMTDGQIETEVNRILIGPSEFLTFPGEVLPNIGLFLKSKMTGQPKFQIGLCSDELGYILTREDFPLELYQYESGVSVGPKIGPLMVDALLALMGETPATRRAAVLKANKEKTR